MNKKENKISKKSKEGNIAFNAYIKGRKIDFYINRNKKVTAMDGTGKEKNNVYQFKFKSGDVWKVILGGVSYGHAIALKVIEETYENPIRQKKDFHRITLVKKNGEKSVGYIDIDIFIIALEKLESVTLLTEKVEDVEALSKFVKKEVYKQQFTFDSDLIMFDEDAAEDIIEYEI